MRGGGAPGTGTGGARGPPPRSGSGSGRPGLGGGAGPEGAGVACARGGWAVRCECRVVSPRAGPSHPTAHGGGTPVAVAPPRARPRLVRGPARRGAGRAMRRRPGPPRCAGGRAHRPP
ncbi:hypothetical protein STTU_6035 [Streptomyces sp. Tu6071]|nr:hypothetical protein STTU_6035 [Streptomyces sp. Tu6071]